ncbi:MAG: hypothetical protein COU90_04695 [Candidatus Ryanbacteria bacterium CG10_big_fil_rev_8_21_14_0_10_43_42]|uniref:UDP-N-acetylglucosamine--N-acetylmuramyl-(pentapeptide) pyrophosphoryl-undecaprenol N-acetylglucosamine transferase n=1 Tax=Candidatus Ryanbacteria bacterium CG10_big_fil_rev_8_21_14_0_10_43_42 TaxID=1974864 RepID=A0A2M8KW49_9BACT|nr:MAG: hypothetical protein COU90_04695 [Candidatus Ryanbacteria bacterium CG10_big_fil_rev_8_21_14_0_10_43_42]
MKIALLGSGSGGHFTPLIAVARELRRIAEDEKLVSLELLLISDEPVDEEILQFEQITFRHFSSGKIRRYFSLKNIGDAIKTFFSVIYAFWVVYKEFPDVIFSKGGYVAFPILFAARFYGIPILIHESDTVPGKVNIWSATFARRIAISFPETAIHFPEEKTAMTGIPIRSRVIGGNEEEARTLFQLETHVPTLLVLGGSQGAAPINDILLQAIERLIGRMQIIHQCGQDNYSDVLKNASVILENSTHKKRYHPFAFLDEDQLRNASHIASVIVSRAGATALYELAAWGIPSILIPLPHAASDHQRKNAYAYARVGGGEVMEESNITPTVLTSQIIHLLEDEALRSKMRAGAQRFARLDAAEKIAHEIIALGLHGDIE